MEVRNINNYQPSVNFKRRLLPAEAKVYKSTIQEGLKVLNKKVGIIVHNSTTPAIGKFNTGIGSLLSITALTNFLPLLATHGVTSIQQEPDNLRRNWTLSPYAPLATGKNIYMIPLEKLTTEEYGIGFRLADEELLNKVNTAIDELTADGTMAKLAEKYELNLAF